MAYYRQQGAYAQSLACGQQIVQLEPLREEIHRELMRLYVASGERALAVRQYERCQAILAAELGIPPMEETQELYVQIAPRTNSQPSRSSAGGEVTTAQQALQQLGKALRACEMAREQVQQAIRRIERVTAGQDHGSGTPKKSQERMNHDLL
jgi:DNA-binding SARP family transcriptional activator